MGKHRGTNNEQVNEYETASKPSFLHQALSCISMVPVVSRHDDVDTCTWLADLGGLLLVHLPQRVGEGSGGIDHTFGPHIKLLPWKAKRSSPNTSVKTLMRNQFYD